MDRDVIERYLQQPGTYLRACRSGGRGSVAVALIYRGDTIASASATSLVAALDALAQALTTRAA